MARKKRTPKQNPVVAKVAEHPVLATLFFTVTLLAALTAILINSKLFLSNSQASPSQVSQSSTGDKSPNINGSTGNINVGGEQSVQVAPTAEAKP